MTLKTLMLILFAEMCSAGMHILYKKGANSLENEPTESIKDYMVFAFKVLKIPVIWCGLVMVCCGMAMWFIVLAHLDLSVAFPLDSIQYIIILAASFLFLGEKLNRDRILGTLFVVLGIVLVAVK
jgi:drug/metabolite transporter (DMT)-like permease